MPPKQEKGSIISGISLVSVSTANSGGGTDVGDGRTTATGISLLNPSNYSGVSGQPTEGSESIPPHNPKYENGNDADSSVLVGGSIGLAEPKNEPKLEPVSSVNNTVDTAIEIPEEYLPTVVSHDDEQMIITPTAPVPAFTDFDNDVKGEHPDDEHTSNRHSDATGSVAGYSNSRVSGSKHSSVYGSSVHAIQFGEPQIIRPSATTSQIVRKKKVVPLISSSLSQKKQSINLSNLQSSEEVDPTVMQTIDLTDLDDHIKQRFQKEAASGIMPAPPTMYKVAKAGDGVNKKKPHRKSVAIKQRDLERGERDAAKKKFFGDEQRAEENIKRRRRKEQGRKIMETILNEISTQTNFTLAVPRIQNHPRLVKPSPSLDTLVDYKPTQLELEWNKKLLSHVDWITLGDVDLVRPSTYDRSSQPDPRDTELLRSAIPYDKIESRDVWKGVGKVPIFSVRPAYTEIGLRDHTKQSKRERLEEERRQVKERRAAKESEHERQERFATGIKQTFTKANQLDEQWLITLIQVGDAIGLSISKDSNQIELLNNDKSARLQFKYLRKQVLYLSSHCSQEGQDKLDDTFLSILPGSSRQEIEEIISLPPLNSKHDSNSLSDWTEAWVDWACLYAEEMLNVGLTISDRTEKFRNPHREGIVKVIQKIHKQKFVDSEGSRTKNELQHPRDPSLNLVSVKEVVAEDDVIRNERDLVVVHFQTSDPLPVDRLVSPDVDFFELGNKKQLAVRAAAPDTLYEGSVLMWKKNLGGSITADYLLPAQDPEMNQKVKRLKHEDLVDCNWDTKYAEDGHAKAVELDAIKTYDGRLLHQRESTFIFRETQSEVKVSYPPRRLVLSLAPDQAHEQATKLRLNDIETNPGRRNHRYLFNWDDDVKKWSAEDKSEGKPQQYRTRMTRFIKKRKAEHAEAEIKRKKHEQADEEAEEQVSQILEHGAEVTENIHPTESPPAEEQKPDTKNPWEDIDQQGIYHIFIFLILIYKR